MPKINWGILGCGLIAHDFVSVLNTVPCAYIKACASRDVARSQAFAKTHGIEKAYGNYEALAQDEEVDILYIATIPSMHYAHAMLAIQNKKNTLIEKPLGTSLHEAETIVEAARSKNVFCAEGIWTHYFPAIQKLRFLIDSGVIGDVTSVHANLGFNQEKENASIIENSRKNLHAALDLGIYLAHMATLCLGHDYIKIYAAGHTINQVNKDGCCYIQYTQNRVARLSWSYLEFYPEYTTIIGKKGRITLKDPWHAPTSLNLMKERSAKLHAAQRHELFTTEKHTFALPMIRNVCFNFSRSEGLLYEIEAIHHCLFAHLKESAQVPLRHSLTAMAIVDKALELLLFSE